MSAFDLTPEDEAIRTAQWERMGRSSTFWRTSTQAINDFCDMKALMLNNYLWAALPVAARQRFMATRGVK